MQYILMKDVFTVLENLEERFGDMEKGTVLSQVPEMAADELMAHVIDIPEK